MGGTQCSGIQCNRKPNESEIETVLYQTDEIPIANLKKIAFQPRHERQ